MGPRKAPGNRERVRGVGRKNAVNLGLKKKTKKCTANLVHHILGKVKGPKKGHNGRGTRDAWEKRGKAWPALEISGGTRMVEKERVGGLKNEPGRRGLFRKRGGAFRPCCPAPRGKRRKRTRRQNLTVLREVPQSAKKKPPKPKQGKRTGKFKRRRQGGRPKKKGKSGMTGGGTRKREREKRKSGKISRRPTQKKGGFPVPARRGRGKGKR